MTSGEIWRGSILKGKDNKAKFARMKMAWHILTAMQPKQASWQPMLDATSCLDAADLFLHACLLLAKDCNQTRVNKEL